MKIFFSILLCDHIHDRLKSSINDNMIEELTQDHSTKKGVDFQDTLMSKNCFLMCTKVLKTTLKRASKTTSFLVVLTSRGSTTHEFHQFTYIQSERCQHAHLSTLATLLIVHAILEDINGLRVYIYKGAKGAVKSEYTPDHCCLIIHGTVLRASSPQPNCNLPKKASNSERFPQPHTCGIS